MNLLGRLKNDWFDRANNLGLSYSTIVIFILLSLAATMTEIFGIGIFLPVFQFIRLGGDLDLLISDSVLWQTIYDVFNYFSIKPSLGGLLLISFFFFSSRQLFTYIRLIYNSTITQKLVQKQRNYIFSRYIEADTSYHDSVPVGNLVNIITTEVSAAVTGIMAPMGLVVYIIMLAGYLGVLFLLSWKMTLVSTIILLLVARIPSAWIKMSAKTGRSLVSSNILMSEFLVGRLQSPRLVRLAGTEIAEKNEFQQLTQTQRKHLVYSSVLQSKTEVTMEPFVIGLSLLFLYFSYSVLLFEIEVIGLYLVIAMRLMPLSKSIILQWQSVQRLMGSIEIIESKLEKMK
jgi:subfamily B ATP-binding cassette protein MsbA